MADRHAAAVAAAATRKARGEKTGFATLSTTKRSSMAKKAAATRKARGIKTGFARASASKRSAMATKAAATRKARGEKSGFALASPMKRHEMALKAAATRKAKGEKPFGTMTAAQRHERALKAAATRRKNHPGTTHHSRLRRRRRSDVVRQISAHKLRPDHVTSRKSRNSLHRRKLHGYLRRSRML